MRKVKKNNNYKNHSIRKCAVCGRNTGKDGVGSPYGTIVCLECAHVIHQVIDQATKVDMRKAFFLQKAPTSDSPEFTPVIPLFTE